MSVKALRCPNCGAPLRQVTDKCEYCGIALVIEGEIVSISEIDRQKWEERQRKVLAMLPNEVREKIQFPKEILQRVSPITNRGFLGKTWTDFWVITNQRLIFYSPKSYLEIKFEDFMSVEVISKSGRLLEIGLRIGFQEEDNYTYRDFLLGHNPTNAEFIEDYKESIKDYFDKWLKCK
jgi:hypothetical protein